LLLEKASSLVLRKEDRGGPGERKKLIEDILIKKGS